MTTERIDIIIREDGSRVVRRNIERMGQAASGADNALKFMKRTLGSIAFGLAAREILQMIDSYTHLQNRLRGVGVEGQVLSSVYEQLLAGANATRSSLENSIEIYARLALNSRELGVSQQELINFTQSLNQAIILSGASIQEAKGALIQFSQGMASGTLRGDELRSVLEQLPAVADVIAKQMGVTRGELRKLGQEGLITSQVILEAFQKAAPGLEAAFGKTIPTMGQALQVLKNSVVDFAGKLGVSSGFVNLVSTSLISLSKNLNAVADAVGRMSIVLLAAAAAYATLLIAARVNVWIEAARSAAAYSQALAAGTVISLGSAQAESARAATIASASAAQVAATASIAAASATAAAAQLQAAVTSTTAAALQANAQRVAIETLRAGTITKLAAVQADRASALAAIKAAEAAGAQSFALATKRAALLQLTAAETAHAALLTQLSGLDVRRAVAVAAQTSAITAQTTAQNALNVAQGRAATATAAATAAGASAVAAAGAAGVAGTAVKVGILSQLFTKLQSVIITVWGYLARFFMLLNTNPFTVLALSIIGVVGLLAGFGDKINSGVDSLTTMQDVVTSFGETVIPIFRSVASSIGDGYDVVVGYIGQQLTAITGITGDAVSAWLGQYVSFYSDVGNGFAGVVRGIAKTLDAIAGLITGMLIGIGRAITGLPKIFEEVFNRVYNAVTSVVQDMINEVIGGVNKLRAFVGAAPLDLVAFTTKEVDAAAFQKYGEGIASSISAGFESQGGFMLNKVNEIFDRAGEIAKNTLRDKLRAMEANISPNLNIKGKPIPVKQDDKERLKAENALRALLNTIIPSEGAVLELAKAERTLDNAVKVGLISRTKSIEYLALAREHYADIIDPMRKVNREIDEENRLLGMSARAREVENQVLNVQRAMKEQGIPLDDAASKALRDRITAQQSFAEQVKAQDQLLGQSVEARREYVVQLKAIQDLLADPTKGFTSGDAAIATMAASPELFAGTQVALDAQEAAFANMYAKIEVFRQLDVANEASASQAKARVDAEYGEFRLKSTSDMYGLLATLSSSGSKRMAAIGKAAAVAQATMDGITAVQKALAAAPGWPYNAGMVIATGVAAAANVAKLAGFEQGGHTGYGGRKEIAGVVHGQEFVSNADATSRNRPMLEAMNRGQTLPSTGGTVVTVVVNNNADGTKATQKERQTPNGREIEVTIETLVTNQIRRGGPIADAAEGRWGLNRAVGAPR